MYTSPFSTSSLASSFLKGIQPTGTIALRQSGSSLYTVSKSGSQEVTVHAYALKNPADPSASVEKRGSAVITTVHDVANVWCSPGGLYAIVSLCDERQLTAEVYGVAIVSKKQKLRVFRVRGIDVPITTLTFVCPHHPVWNLTANDNGESNTTSQPANEEIEGVQSPEFLFATSDNCLNVGQIVKHEAKIVRKTKVISISKGTILQLHTIPINYSTVNAARKLGMQNYDQYSAPSADIASSLADIPAYKILNVMLTLVCSRGLIKAYLHTVRSLFDMVFSSKAEVTRFDLTEVEVLQRGPIINTVADLFYSATGPGLTYQIVSQSAISPNLLVYQYNISLRKIFETVLRTRASALLKIDYQDRDSDAGAGYTELQTLLKKCDASSFVNFVIDVARVRGFDARDPVLVCLDDSDGGDNTDKQRGPPGALLGMVVYNYHSIIILANRLSVFNSISRSQVTMLPNPVVYSDILLKLHGLSSAQLSKLYTLLQNQFIYSGAEVRQTFPTITDGIVDLSTVLHCYILLSYGKISGGGTASSSIGSISLNVQDEASSMWFIYYALHEYDKALQYCSVESTKKLIREEYAKQCLASDRVLQGARLLSQTDLPLLDVYRDLIGIRKYEAAVLYLQEKLQKMPAHNAALARAANTIRVADFDSLMGKEGSGALSGCLGVTKEQADQANYCVARKLLIHMLIEAMILEIDSRMHAVETYRVLMEKNEDGAHLAMLQAEDQVDVYKAKLKAFLTNPDYVSALDLSVLRSSLLDHGLDDVLLEFSKYKKDSRSLFTSYLLTHNYKEALQILADQDLDLFYYHSNTLLARIPRDYLNVVRKKTKHVAVLAAEASGAKHSGSKEQTFALSKLTKCFVEALNNGDAEVMRELVSFFRWLLLDEEGSIEPSVNTFAFEFLAKAGEEELLSSAIDIIPVDFSVDTSIKKFNLLDITGVCRKYSFKDCEAKCLSKTGNQLDALALSLSLHKKIPLADIDFGRKEDCIVDMIKTGDLKGETLSQALSASDGVCTGDTCDSVSSLHASLPNENEVLILDAIDLIDKSHRVEQKRQLVKTLITWLISIQLHDPTDSLSARGWLSLNPSLSTAQVYGIVEMVFRQLMLLRATELMFDFSFVSLTEVTDLILSTGAPYNVVADSIHLTFKHYQNRSMDIKRSLDKCVSQIVAKKCDLEEARQRTVAHEGQKVCGVCMEYLNNSRCLASGLGIRKSAKKGYNFLMDNHTVFFCGHAYHTACLAFHLAPLSNRINKLVRECEAAAHNDGAIPTGLIDKLVGKLASSCPLCDAHGVEEIATDICDGIPLLLRL